MLVRNRISLFLLSLAMGLAQAHPSYPEYRVTIVGPPDSTPTDINQAGVVVSNVPTGITTSRAYISRGTGYREIVMPDSTSNRAVAINDKGVVLGNWTAASGENRGFTFYRGTRRDIPPVPARAGVFVDINNAGYILTLAGPPPGAPTDISPFAFLRAPNGSFRPIGILPYENAINQAEALNNRNQVTGESGTFFRPELPFNAYVWTNGVIRELPDLGYTPNYGLDINDRGQVSGYVAIAEFRQQRAALWSHGRLTLVDTRPDSAMPFSTGEALNNYGQVVGSANGGIGAFIYRGRRMESLQAKIDPTSGWGISFPRAINDAGQIAATGYRAGVAYAVRLDPIRPHLMAPPPLDEGSEAGPLLETTPAADAAQAQASAQPVTQ
ncbi:HAF repeat-containing protein [Massilia sp. Dwa41.01b]|uniref:HAF repeat-containing protein n=1 Tax=unclassified Massilia TaxID=2609279 RepID=UPI001603800C|nr:MULTISPECIES: HAF repeat-containing protein [unclassified Massilia]QNA90341.1 HAF repeat-containing protein [Massilia sp. Dwa41.01b]QNB01241.1 HAF repeat-containing protein [Massilia sp. Se16.2.3]